MVKKTINAANAMELKHEIKEKCKMLKNPDLVNEEFSRKEYLKKLNIQQGRTKFKFRCSMTQHVKINQKSNPQYAESLWRCEECSPRDIPRETHSIPSSDEKRNILFHLTWTNGWN